MKIFDCLIFYNENFLVNARINILYDVVDYFVICESKFDLSGNKKKLNFKLLNKKFKKKIRYLKLSSLPINNNDPWKLEALQREKLFDGIYDSVPEDIIMYSDSDEIPSPNILQNIKLRKKYAILLMKMYSYKLNIYNPHETPWEGTRVCKRKDLKSFSYLRKNILVKNLRKKWRLNIEKNIQIINNGGWHFNNLYSPKVISKKLKVFPHKEFSLEKYSDIEIIKKKIFLLQDLFGRGNNYKKVKIDKNYPKYIFKNKTKLKKYIL